MTHRVDGLDAMEVQMVTLNSLPRALKLSNVLNWPNPDFSVLAEGMQTIDKASANPSSHLWLSERVKIMKAEKEGATGCAVPSVDKYA